MSNDALSNAHKFIPAAPGDSRSPCPALNALANHGHLPRNGKHITAPQLIHALRSVYHLSLPLATILTIGGTTMCGNGWALDLEDLAKHDKIEHDASLTHADAPEGNIYAPIPVDKSLLQDMLDTSSGDYLTLDDLVKTRVSRDETLVHPLNSKLTTIARGEVALTVEMFGDAEGRVSKEFVRQWFGEQRLPVGWVRPKKNIGLIATNNNVKHVGQLCAQLAEAKKNA
ncbi:Cloroperoxidase [Artomyces pyxidatus]|uniref:Cloroperoxidase n=1 Tax=Artomyces pyxidatus TaxID=48021 RepID=A0ACB8TJW9_9AGAM|nr:Cloroperoxidase [Artomyces pyxidatus]